MSNITNYNELKDEVDKVGGVLTVHMQVLRNIHGADRLGVNVRANISGELKGHGLAHYPSPLPDDQWTYARVYKQGTQVAKIIGAVLDPNPQTDETLRQAGSGNAENVLKKIRELIEE